MLDPETMLMSIDVEHITGLHLGIQTVFDGKNGK
jgi:hypothetical protein